MMGRIRGMSKVSKFCVLTFGWIFLSLGFTVHSGSLYKWVDADGNVTYQDSPPPSSVEFEEQSYVDPDAQIQEDLILSMDQAAEQFPISFYSVPDCDTCDLIRLYLQNHAIPFAEKDIDKNVVLQRELQLKIGQLKVPTLIIGDDIIDGYSKREIKRLLEEKGYPINRIEQDGLQVEVESSEDERASLSESELESISNESVTEGVPIDEEILDENEIDELEPISEIEIESN